MEKGLISCYHSIDLCIINAQGESNDEEDENHFKSSEFLCELSPINSQCTLNCADNNSCDNSEFECFAPNCDCIGSHCGDLKTESTDTAPPSTSILGTTLPPTLHPTSVTSMPTKSPSADPSTSPSYI